MLPEAKLPSFRAADSNQPGLLLRQSADKQLLHCSWTCHRSYLPKPSYRTSAKDFQVKDSSGAVVYEGKTDASRGNQICDGSETYNQIIDFSDFQTEGTGYTITCDGKTSLPFDIGNNIYDGMTTNAMNYFYQNRSGVNIDAAYITSQGENSDKSKLARKAGHNPDTGRTPPR